MDQASFGALLRRLRLAQPDPADPASPLGMRALAKRLGCAHSTIKRLESGDRGVSRELAAALDTALHADGEILAAASDLPKSPGRWPRLVPRLLPPPQHPLIGRDDEVTDLVGRLRAAHWTCVAPPVLLLSGPGGVGKTALALSVAHHLAPGLEGGALYADLRGWSHEDDPRPIEAVLRTWCRALGVPAQVLDCDTDELLGTWRHVTADRQLLVVIDNATAEQIDSLIPASPDSIIIVTTRDRLAETTGAIPYPVEPLGTHAATELLATYTDMSTDSLTPLVNLCGGMPLALRTAAQEARHHWTEETISDMAQVYDVADELTPVDRSTRLSYAALPDEVQQAWLLCCLASGSVTLGEAAAMIGTHHRTARRLLNTATDAHLLDHRDGRWLYHDVHLAFARREATRSLTTDERDSSVYRGLTWVLHGTARAARVLAARDDTPINLVPCPPEVTPPDIACYEEGMAWCNAHWHASTAPITAAINRGWTPLAWQLVATSLNYVFLTKRLAAWDRAAQAALDAAEAADDAEGLGWMHAVRGSVAGDRGDFPRAVHHLQTSLDYRRALGQAHARDIGWSAINAARWMFAGGYPSDKIAPYVDEGVAAHESINYPPGPVLGLAFHGGLAAREQDWTRAEELLAAAYERTPEVNDPAITAFVATMLADARFHLGRLDDAAATAREANDHAREADADSWRIGALSVLAHCVPETEAAHHLRLAISICEAHGDPREQELRARLGEQTATASEAPGAVGQ